MTSVPAFPSPMVTVPPAVSPPLSMISLPVPGLLAPRWPMCRDDALKIPPASETVPLLPMNVSADVVLGRLDHFPLSPHVPSALIHVWVVPSNGREIASDPMAMASARTDRDPRICATFMTSPSPKQARDVLPAATNSA